MTTRDVVFGRGGACSVVVQTQAQRDKDFENFVTKILLCKINEFLQHNIDNY